ncbi:MAG: hypothetical protein AB7V59_19320, partial [Gammaproteobacteria bacterium]
MRSADVVSTGRGGYAGPVRHRVSRLAKGLVLGLVLMAGGAQARAAVILRSTTAQISGQAQFISPNVSVEESGSIRTRPGAP